MIISYISDEYRNCSHCHLQGVTSPFCEAENKTGTNKVNITASNVTTFPKSDFPSYGTFFNSDCVINVELDMPFSRIPSKSLNCFMEVSLSVKHCFNVGVTSSV